MRLLVTGGAGYIGSICVETLLDAGHEVLILDNFSEGHHAAIDPRAKCIEIDLAELEKLITTFKKFSPDAVLHFAGKALVSESMKDPSIYYRVNVSCGVNVLDAMLASNCKKIIFSSSCATYGIPEKMPIDERTPQKPVNPYGHSKLLFEQILKWYEQIHGITHVILRYFNAAGASKKLGEHHRVETHLIPNVLKVALGQAEYVPVYGNHYPTPDATCIRDYIHVLDLASAHRLALDVKESAAYNLGTGDGHSVLQIVEAARKVTGHEIPVQFLPPRAGDPPRLVASAHKIHQELGWVPQFSHLTELVTSAWNWHKAHKKGYAD